MINRNDSFAPARPYGAASPANVPAVGHRPQTPPGRVGGESSKSSSLADLMSTGNTNEADDEDPVPTANAGRVSLQQCESLGSIVSDVEEFARDWIGRIRQIIQRSAQLVEREALLAGAIARLDQQKADWNKRTAVREANLRDQAKRLTEAWLEVESERRKHSHGGGGATPHLPSQSTRTHTATPAVPQPAQANQQTPPVVNTPAVLPTATGPPAAHHAGGPRPAAPANVAQLLPAAAPMLPPVSNSPVTAGTHPATPRHDDPQACEVAERQKKQRIEEFRRMQRSLQSNQNP